MSVHPLFQQTLAIMSGDILRPEHKRVGCTKCGGSGTVTVTRNRGHEDEETTEGTCSKCYGDGFVESEK